MILFNFPCVPEFQKFLLDLKFYTIVFEKNIWQCLNIKLVKIFLSLNMWQCSMCTWEVNALCCYWMECSIYLLGPFGWKCCSNPVFSMLIFCLNNLSIVLFPVYCKLSLPSILWILFDIFRFSSGGTYIFIIIKLSWWIVPFIHTYYPSLLFFLFFTFFASRIFHQK